MNENCRNSEDITLVQSVLWGDKADFAKLIEKYKFMIFNLIYRLTGNYSEAEDLTQESFLKAYKHLGHFNITQTFRNWLYTIAVNVCRSGHRKNRIFFFSLSQETDDREDTWEARLGDSSDNPESLLLKQESEKKVQKIIMILPYKYRTVFVLRFLENRSYQEISSITEIPLGTVKTFLFRGQKILSGRFADETFFK